jgi:hypothetical protein
MGFRRLSFRDGFGNTWNRNIKLKESAVNKLI